VSDYQNPGPEMCADRGCFWGFGVIDADADEAGASVAMVVSSVSSAGGATSGKAALTMPAEASTVGLRSGASVDCRVRVREITLDELDRDGRTERRVTRLPDRPHPTTPDTPNLCTLRTSVTSRGASRATGAPTVAMCAA
jgi:hypothetical protein